MMRARFFDALWQDLRYSARTLAKRPAFTLTAALTLGLGIGATTAIFSVVSAFLLRPLPVRDAGRLVVLGTMVPSVDLPGETSYPNYRDIRADRELFSDAIAYSPSVVSLRIDQTAERRWIETVSDNYFSMLGVDAALGRTFTPDEAHSGAPVIVVSHAFWESHFAGDPGVVGRTVFLNGLPFTVIGVLPQSFPGTESVLALDAYISIQAAARLVVSGGKDVSSGNSLSDRGAGAWEVMARLAPGLDLAQARARAAVLAEQLAAQYPAENKGMRLVIYPEPQARPTISVAHLMPQLAAVFLALVGAVLLIACANVGGLLLARGAARQSEMALRLAIGATPSRLVRQLLTESILLALLGMVIGIAVASEVTHALAQLHLGSDLPIRFAVGLDWRVLVFAFIATLAVGIICGLGPAIHGARIPAQEMLKEGTRTAGNVSHNRFRNALVVFQVAISLVLLIGAGLFARTLEQVTRVDLGFRPDHLLMLSVDVSLQRYDSTRGERFYREMLNRATNLPGVRTAAVASGVPMGLTNSSLDVYPGGDAVPVPNGRLDVLDNEVSPGYFDAMGIPLLAGRAFTARDDSAAPRVAIINEALATRLWPHQSAIGRKLRIGPKKTEVEVVGVAKTGKYIFITDHDRTFIYFPLAQRYQTPVTLTLRTVGDPAGLAPAARALITGLDKDLAVYDVTTMTSHLKNGLALLFFRLGAVLAGAIGLLGLAQTAVGLYGVVSYTVSQRTREMGIRMALGARQIDVVGAVVMRGMRLALIGLVIGLVLAALASQTMTGLLAGVSPFDWVTFVMAAATLIASTLVASYIPARRAARMQPVAALREG